MPEMPERTPAASGDYLGRLLARYAPAPPSDPFGPPDGADASGRRTRVRPRLPGPFERVEALRGPAAVEPDDDGRLAPRPSGWPAPSPGAAEPPRAERWSEIRTRHERETVLRTEAAPVADPDRAAADRGPGPAPLLRPAATAVPGTRAAAEGVRPRGRSTAPGGERTAAGRGAPPGDPEAAEPATGVLRPRTDAVPAPRRPAPPRAGSAGGRRGPRGPAERVVHVQIGRLEVSTAGAADSRRPTADGHPARPERRAPALSLADYLASQQRTSGGRST